MIKSKKRIGIIGSTGSIGTQCLEIVAQNPESFQIVLLTANNNVALLIEQALVFKPKAVVIANQAHYQTLKEALSETNIAVHAGHEAITEQVQMPEIETLLTAVVGYSGLLPTIKAIEAGKHIALSNKETLVVAGEIIMQLAKKHQVNIYPVDSEHSAIFQCLVGEESNPIEKLILTASGGPFRGKTKEELSTVTKAQALKHPNWTMGAKVTIDSASLMNKGLEVIEAKWIFDVDISKIEVVVHAQSIIHSLVQFEDGSIKAQLGVPDMKVPIQYALTYPKRLVSNFERFNFLDYPQFTFEEPDKKTFRNLELAFNAIKKGGNMPCILNAANEIAVAQFLSDKVRFLEMSDIIANCMDKVQFLPHPSYEDYVETDKMTRQVALGMI